MNDYKKRLETEQAEVRDKIEKLSNFLEGDEIDKIDPNQKILLSIQYKAMSTYLECLNNRLDLM